MARKTDWLIVLALFSWLFGVLHASAGDEDPLYRSCIEICEGTGHCQPSSVQMPFDVPKIIQMWKHWSCRSDCRCSCVAQIEMERRKLGLEPLKYHGKWAKTRSSFLQNVISVMLPALNLIAQLRGWYSFFHLHLKSHPAPTSETGSYEYAGLWHIQGFLATNAWFWSSICQVREFDVTERLAYSTTVALISYSLVLSIIRTFNLIDEEPRVIVAAPILGLAATHICYLNFADLDYGLNETICGCMCMAQLLLWFTWAVKTRHPSMHKLWPACIGGGISVLLELVDSRTLWHAIAIPLTCLWWSFVGEDAGLAMKKAK